MSAALDVKSLKGLTQDSRAVKDGYLFAALPGSKTDGRLYIEDAIRNGARVILGMEGTALPQGADTSKVRLVLDSNPQRRLALIASEFYGRQPPHIAAVTGTNGKTSVVHMLRQIWKSQGHQAASLGTLGVQADGTAKSGSMTTPDPISLHAELADMAGAGVTHLAMEASSHGLDQHRLDGVNTQAAGFTNLSRDHLDYHSGMEDYFHAKLRLFSDILLPGKTAVLNADIPEFSTLEKAAKDRKLKILSYGREGRDLKILDLTPHPRGQRLKADIQGKAVDIDLPLVGGFQTMNALCAFGLALAVAGSHDTLSPEILQTLTGAPGRLQIVAHPAGASVYIDYAHTPDALETILKALRLHTQNRLVCLFGCGGNRDRGKRPLMGALACALADEVIVTDDNPRTENPADIRAAILQGAPCAREIEGRRLAIREAIGALKKGDVLVIAGKGHEQGQIFADRTDPFDDAGEAAAAIRELKPA